MLGQTNVYDDFDSYKAGEFLSTESNGLWTTWTNAGGTPEDTYVTDQLSFSSENSIQLVSGGVVDVVLPLGNESSGSWTLSFMMLWKRVTGPILTCCIIFLRLRLLGAQFF